MAKEGSTSLAILLEEAQMCINWDDVICPICLNFPHNCVLLECSSYEKGCRAFVCDTDQLHSNCLDRYKEANGVAADSKPVCPLCRGEVCGWRVVQVARKHLDVKIRCCEEEECPFTGTYPELQKHAKMEHPHACPSKIDPAHRLDWENFERSSELIDVLTYIQSEAPNGIILGDYVVDYEEENSGDEGEDLNEDEGKWWRSCIFSQILESFTTCRNRRRRSRESRRGGGGSRRSNSDQGSVENNNADDGHTEPTGSREISRERSGQHSSRRHLSRSNDN